MKRIITLLLLMFAVQGLAQTIRNVSAEEAQSLIAGGGYEIIDLRTDNEITSKGMLKGAKQIDFLAPDAEAQIKKLDRTKSYLIYCAGGGRSSQCAELMEQEKFQRVVHLEKGYDDWKKKGLATVSR